MCKDFSQRLGDVSHTREREVGEGLVWEVSRGFTGMF